MVARHAVHEVVIAAGSGGKIVSDPLGFPVLAGSAITQAFGFLYGRLAVLLDRHDSRHDKEDHPDHEDRGREMGTAISGPADKAVLEELRPSLRALADILDVYDKNPEMLDGEDAMLRHHLGCLRAALEVIYHQRIAFSGEEPRSSGVNIEQDADEVSGELIGLISREVSRSAQVGVSQKLKKIHKGGKAVGARITRIE
jgi:hypothetical protein